MAGKFGFISHPLEVRDLRRRYGCFGWFPERWMEAAACRLPPGPPVPVRGIRSPFNEAEGWLVQLPLTGRQIMSLSEKIVIDKIVAGGRLAERRGARIIGLGGLTALVGDAGRIVAHRLEAGVTTGISYTVYTAIEAVRVAARSQGIDLAGAEVVVLGAAGPVGRVCSLLMAQHCRHLTLVGDQEARLEVVAAEVLRETGLSAQVSMDVKKSLAPADVIIAVSSAVDAAVEAGGLKSGAIICDVVPPRALSRQVAEARADVLVIEGGVVDAPGDVKCGPDGGQPPKACLPDMAETMILALEERYDDSTLGWACSLEDVHEIARLAGKHGFRVSGARRYEPRGSQALTMKIRSR